MKGRYFVYGLYALLMLACVASGFHIPISKHYCGGKVKQVSLGNMGVNCCGGIHDTPPYLPDGVHQESCCKDKLTCVATVEVVSQTRLIEPAYITDLTQLEAQPVWANGMQETRGPARYAHPPPPDIGGYILFQVFRI